MSLQGSPLFLRRTQFKLVDKLRIAEAASASGWIKRTARLEGTSSKNVRRWLEQKDILEKKVKDLKSDKITRRYKLSGGLGRSALIFGPDIDSQLYDYYRELRDKAMPVSVRLLIAKWKTLEPIAAEQLSENAARMRMYRWMKRNNVSFRSVTHQAQAKPESRQTAIDFVDYISMKVEMLGISWARVANFDETNIYFSPDIKHTLADRGSRSVAVRKLDSSNRCSAMLGCNAVGHKYPPFIIWKGENKVTGRIIRECGQPQKHGLADGLIYTVQEKAWMDEPAMLTWVEKVWKPITETAEGPWLLILDEAQAHLTQSVRLQIAATYTELEIIPGGYTSKLQVMDVGVNKQFKDRIRKNVEQFIISEPVGTKPRRSHLSWWIKDSWDAVAPMTIQKTWHHIGYTTAGIDCARLDDSESDSDNKEDPLVLVDVPRVHFGESESTNNSNK